MSSDKKYFNKEINAIVQMLKYHETLIEDNFSECMKKFAKHEKEIEELKNLFDKPKTK